MLNCLALLLASATGLADLGPVPADSVRVYLVRHGQAFSNLDPTPDLPPEKLDRLTALGTTQSERTALALRGRDIRLVISSPAGRAKGTADVIGRALEVYGVRVEPRLRPLELGRSETGQPLEWDERIASWKKGLDPSPPGGESMSDVAGRVLDLVKSLRPDHKGGSVVLVAHSEVIGAFVGLVGRVPPAARYPPNIANGSISVVEMADSPLLLLTNYVPAEK
jgi:probable phosphoglycerate mutase